MTLLGQALIFHVGRHYTQAALNWASITNEEITLLKDVLRQHAVTSLVQS
ncbi:CerR family C-terminal domain-containing protein [Pseudomonas savastanoi]|nr:CerR family C-terminal domain-containing protein [Pseudomonas savastanoi]